MERVIKDFRGYPCPVNYARTRLALHHLSSGTELEVWLDAGEPSDNVPRSLMQDGFPILEQGWKDERQTIYRVLTRAL